MDERVDAISMQEIWEGCTPLDAKDQKPLFKAEQEAEKALGYLEGLSLTQLAAALLSSGNKKTASLSLLPYLLSCSLTFPNSFPHSHDLLLFHDHL
jgi:hypothetical protein